MPGRRLRPGLHGVRAGPPDAPEVQLQLQLLGADGVHRQLRPLHLHAARGRRRFQGEVRRQVEGSHGDLVVRVLDGGLLDGRVEVRRFVSGDLQQRVREEDLHAGREAARPSREIDLLRAQRVHALHPAPGAPDDDVLRRDPRLHQLVPVCRRPLQVRGQGNTSFGQRLQREGDGLGIHADLQRLHSLRRALAVHLHLGAIHAGALVAVEARLGFHVFLQDREDRIPRAAQRDAHGLGKRRGNRETRRRADVQGNAEESLGERRDPVEEQEDDGRGKADHLDGKVRQEHTGEPPHRLPVLIETLRRSARDCFRPASTSAIVMLYLMSPS